MPGNEIIRERIVFLEEKGEDWVERELLEADNVHEFARNIWQPHGEGAKQPGLSAFYDWIKEGGEAREKWYDDVKRKRAHIKFERAQDRLNNATVHDVRLREAQAKADRWAAGKMHPDYADQPSVQINNTTVDFGSVISQALAALEKKNEIVAPEPKALPEE